MSERASLIVIGVVLGLCAVGLIALGMQTLAPSAPGSADARLAHSLRQRLKDKKARDWRSAWQFALGLAMVLVAFALGCCACLAYVAATVLV